MYIIDCILQLLLLANIACVSIYSVEALWIMFKQQSISISEFIFWSFTLRAVDMMKPGNTVVLRNAKIDMFKGSMRLAVDKWGRVEVGEPAKFEVKEDNNLSLVEYELVNVVEESWTRLPFDDSIGVLFGLWLGFLV